MKRKRKISKADVQRINPSAGLLSTRYPPGGDRAQRLRRLTKDSTTPESFRRKLANIKKAGVEGS